MLSVLYQRIIQWIINYYHEGSSEIYKIYLDHGQKHAGYHLEDLRNGSSCSQEPEDCGELSIHYYYHTNLDIRILEIQNREAEFITKKIHIFLSQKTRFPKTACQTLEYIIPQRICL